MGISANDGFTPDSLSVSWAGSQIAGASDLDGFDYALYQYSLKASSSTATLTIAFSEPDGFYDLDDVSMTPSFATPEPSTLAIAGVVASLALGFRLRRAGKAREASAAQTVGRPSRDAPHPLNCPLRADSLGE
jgi:hypothetical protein